MAPRWLQSSAQDSAYFLLLSPQAGEMRWDLCTGAAAARLVSMGTKPSLAFPAMRVALAEVCLAGKFNPCLPPVMPLPAFPFPLRITSFLPCLPLPVMVSFY